jgi:hypothetical protein
LEAEAIADEFNRLMTTSTYKGRDVFNTTAGSLYVSMGGRDQEMTFGIGTITYTDLYDAASERTIAAATATSDGPNKDTKFNLAHLPSDAVVIKDMGKAAATNIIHNTSATPLLANKTYIVTSLDQDGGGAIAASETTYGVGGESADDILQDATAVYRYNETGTTTVATNDELALGDVFVMAANAVTADVETVVVPVSLYRYTAVAS